MVDVTEDEPVLHPFMILQLHLLSSHPYRNNMVQLMHQVLIILIYNSNPLIRLACKTTYVTLISLKKPCILLADFLTDIVLVCIEPTIMLEKLEICETFYCLLLETINCNVCM